MYEDLNTLVYLQPVRLLGQYPYGGENTLTASSQGFPANSDELHRIWRIQKSLSWKKLFSS